MTMQTVMSNIAPRATAPSGWSLPGLVSPAEAGKIVLSFLDAAATSLGRATHYNNREEQQKAELLAHDALLWLDRDLYAVLLALQGVTDRARQVGIKNLLATPRDDKGALLDDAAERRLIARLADSLPPQRVLKLFDGLRVGSPEDGIRKANNARTRKLILRTILGSNKLELWSVKYRSKLSRALTHAWGVRMTSIVRAILGKEDAVRTAKERAILRKAIDRNASLNRDHVYACVAFVLGHRGSAGVPLLAAYEAAKADIMAGAKLPPEVLEGIRSVFHKGTPKEKVLEITAGSLTKTQRLEVQKRAAEARVDVKMDPADYDPIRLYVYAFEMGMTVEIARALLDKAQKAARAFPVHYGTIGILVDASASMMGAADQKLRPMATALALRDMLQHTAPARVVVSGGDAGQSEAMLVRPAGDTSLAEGLLDLLGEAVEAVFVISDGYENRPAGRFAEVVSALRAMGNTTPIFQLTPVFAAESAGVRELCPGLVPALPVSRPEALGISMLRGLLEADPARGIAALVRLALPTARGGEA
ncbi:MAG: hypothetical protein QM820_17980 [Minicystis sp.]